MLDEDGDLILDRNICKSIGHNFIEASDHTFVTSNVGEDNESDSFDRNQCVSEKISEEISARKKIKLGEHCNASKASVSPIEDKIKVDSVCCTSENTVNDDLEQEPQNSDVTCQHCDSRLYENQNTSNESDKRGVLLESDRNDIDGINVCKICDKKKLPVEYGQNDIRTKSTVVEDSDIEVRKVIDESDDNAVDTYYINIKHSLSTDLTDVGEQVWHGSLLLSDFIICNHGFFDNKVIIDLGAGVGLSSIVAAMYAKAVYCTDTGEKILSLAESNISTAKTCPTLPRPLCDIHIKELDWFKEIEENSCKFGLTRNDIHEINNSDILIAADVIYDFDITDAFFNMVKQIMSHTPSKTLYIGLEKRLVFTCEDLTVTSPGYNYFRLHLDDLCAWEDNETEIFFETEQIDANFPQFFQYKRIKQLELWKITATFKS